ncbi:MAG: MATE family efflux transporter [Cellulosilyticaceae bacterium]
MTKETKQMMGTIFILAVPVIIENILQVLLGTTDTLFAGKLDGNAIAGIGVTNLIMNIYIAFFTAVGVGTTAIIARKIGDQKIDEAENALKQSVILGALIGIGVGIVSICFAEPLLRLLGAAPEVMAYAKPYFMVVAVPCVVLCLMQTLSSALRGAGDTKTPMIAATIANIINIPLNYILIFGIFGFEGWGIVGAGLATTLSRIVALGILAMKLQKGQSKLHLNFKESWKIDKEMMGTIGRIGIPAGMEKLIMRLGQLVYGSMIITLGTSSYIAHNVAGTIESYSYLPAMGFGVATTTLVGQQLGARKIKDAKKYAYVSNILSSILMIVIGILFFIGAPFLAALFTEDAEVKLLVVKVLRIIALFQPLLSLSMIMASALQGAGDTKFPMYATLVGIWGIRVAGGYLLAVVFGLGLVGIWLAYALDVSVRGILMFLRFRKAKWAQIII